MKNLVKKLTESFAPSGFESPIREMVLTELKGHYDESQIDPLGNLILLKKASNRSAETKKVMVAAHMDEIGIIATHIEKDGFVRFAAVGGVFPRNLQGGRIRFMNGTRGVIGTEESKPGESSPIDKCFIDVGAISDGFALRHPPCRVWGCDFGHPTTLLEAARMLRLIFAWTKKCFFSSS